MGIGLLEIGVKMTKAVIFPIKVCYRTVWNHPFLVCMLCFFAFLYTSFPFVFSLLVTVSPVLVCTALLLGTLLSYGQPNIPHFEMEENTADGIVPLKTGLSRDVSRVENDNRYTDQERDKVDQSTDKSSLLSEVHRCQVFADHSPLVDGASRVAREFDRQKNEDKIGDEDLMENQYSPTSKADDESVEFDNDKSVDSFDSRRVNPDSPPGSPWKHREEEYSEALDSGSDRAESSSPDASIADIMPMLDELHPLLDEDNPQPVNISHDVSHAASESSSDSDGDNESDDGSEDQEELEAADDENEDEEETRDKEDPKSAITWTEEDEKNLMDLGSSELERNQRLESLIARRRSRKNMSLIDEKNLIDLVSADFPLNMPPISTARQNPFDLPSDNYDLGLPPIPGSAPSILLPRRNPFDLPYDPSEEKPDLTGDNFQQEFITSQPKEPFFRRHESFSVGPSIFGLNKQDKKDIRLRPYFVPDMMASEGTSYSPFQRHPSDLSDSKVSSVLETESQGSIEDLEDKNLTEEDVEDKNLNEEHMFKEPQLISKIENAADDVGHGSQSSEEVECLVLGAADKRDIELNDTDVKLQNAENHHRVGPVVFHEEATVSSMELDPSKISSKSETSEEKFSSQSSSSSSSEVSERTFADKEVARLSSEEVTSHVETISGQHSPNGSELNISSSSVDESLHFEPIYDASPPSIKKNISSSSIASDPLPQSEMELPPELVKRTVSFIEREPVENNQDIEKSIPTREWILSSVDSQELWPREEVMDKDDLDIAKSKISKCDEVFDSAGAPPEHVRDSPASIDLKSSKKEPPVSPVESIEKAGTTESLNVSKIKEVPPIISSPRDPESVLKPPNTKVANEESESSKNGPVPKVTSLKDDHEMGLPTVEPRPTEDVDLIHKHLPEEDAERPLARDSKGKGASSHSQSVGTDSATEQVVKNHTDKPNTSFQRESETEPSEASSSKNSELSPNEFVVSEISEADVGKVDHKAVKQDDKATTTGKSDHVVELPQETGLVKSDVKGKKEIPTSEDQVQETPKENEDS